MRYLQDEPAYIRNREVRKRKLLAGLDVSRATGMEIGALCRPFVTREEGSVVYVDHTDTASLREKYKADPQVDPARIVDVDTIWGSQSLHTAVEGRQFDYIVASHVIEHVPDLITWLRELGSVLKPSGELRLIVPDRRFTFDYFRRTTQLGDVLLSHMVRARVPQPHSLLDFCLNVVPPEQVDPWHERPLRQACTPVHTWDAAVHLANDAVKNGAYHDVHCWVFTPRSFAVLMGEIAATGLIDFACERFFDTAHHQNEFFVATRRSTDRGHIVSSWATMAQLAVDVDPGERFWRLKRTWRGLMRRREAMPARAPGKPSPHDPVEPLMFPGDFDSEAYLLANEDVRAAGSDPFAHFQHCGWIEGRPIRPARGDLPTRTR